MKPIALEKAILTMLDNAPDTGVSVADIHVMLGHEVAGMRIENTLQSLVASREAIMRKVPTEALGQSVMLTIYQRGERFRRKPSGARVGAAYV